MKPEDVPEGDRIYPGATCDLCGTEIEILDIDGKDVMLSCPNGKGDDEHDEYCIDILRLAKWGWKFDDENIINAAIDDDITEQYIFADFGERLGVYSDGSIAIGQSVGDEIGVDERPIAVIGCPGFPNMDQSVFTEPWKYDEDNDVYIDEDGVSHDIQKCVMLAIENDPSFKDEIIEKLIIYIRDE